MCATLFSMYEDTKSQKHNNMVMGMQAVVFAQPNCGSRTSRTLLRMTPATFRTRTLTMVGDQWQHELSGNIHWGAHWNDPSWHVSQKTSIEPVS